MSNETDLDWLARNVHAWPEITPQSIPTGDRTFEYGCTFYENHICIYHKEFANSRVIYKNQWLSRRAELQSVTEQFKPSIEEANRLAQEFKLFTSIEDNHGHEMKHDNGWFERRELPPVGTECIFEPRDGKCYFNESELRAKGQKVTIIAHTKYKKGDGSVAVFQWDLNDCYGVSSANQNGFRPIRTELDVLISIIVEEMNRYDTDGKLADAILVAGFSLRDK